MTTSPQTTDEPTEEAPQSLADCGSLKAILHHLLDRHPTNEAWQAELHGLVENLHVSPSDKAELAEVETAPPGYEAIPGRPGEYRRLAV